MRIIGLVSITMLACTPDVSNDTEDSETGAAREAPRHNADIQPIWDARCGDCHIEYNEGSLRLVDAFDSIVRVRSEDLPGMSLITPYEPKQSYLWLKMQGTHIESGGQGAGMPMGDNTPTDKEYTRIRLWIEQGALR